MHLLLLLTCKSAEREKEEGGSVLRKAIAWCSPLVAAAPRDTSTYWVSRTQNVLPHSEHRGWSLLLCAHTTALPSRLLVAPIEVTRHLVTSPPLLRFALCLLPLHHATRMCGGLQTQSHGMGITQTGVGGHETSSFIYQPKDTGCM